MTSEEDRKPSGVRPSLFLERQSYRRRRLADAARLLPFLGAALMVIPLLWPDDQGAQDGLPLSSAIFYIFTCWAAMIAVSLVFGFAARRLSSSDVSETETDQWQR